jgi:hypothetical protein
MNENDDRLLLSPFNLMGILSRPSQGLHIHELLPSQWQSMQLWQIYVNNVDPLMKVLHIPTSQVTIFTAIENPRETRPNDNVLLFAIYFAAAIATEAESAYNILGQEREAFLDKAKYGFEQCLVETQFLEHPSVTSLQALAIYLVSLKYANEVAVS